MPKRKIMSEKEKIEQAANEFVDNLWQRLGKNILDGIGISGSFARGNFSIARPDVNIILFVKKDIPELYLGIAEIFNEISKKYKEDFNIWMRSEPERPTFLFKETKTKKDIFFKLSFLQLTLKDSLSQPFGRPPSQAESLSKGLKMRYGKNYLANLKITCSNKQILEGFSNSLQSWRKILRYTPSSYTWEKNVDSFFNEALAYGKLFVYQSVWVVGLLKGLDFSKRKDREKVLEIIFNKEKLRNFLSEFKKPEVLAKINLILDSRSHYQEWKSNLKRAKDLYQAAYTLCDDILKIVNRLKRDKNF